MMRHLHQALTRSGLGLALALTACAPRPASTATPPDPTEPAIVIGAAPTRRAPQSAAWVPANELELGADLPATPQPAAQESLPASAQPAEGPQPLTVGMTLPAAVEPITAANVARLTRVAAWGRGSIEAVSFSPDGRSFVVGSPFGLAVYALDQLTAEPAWHPFEAPVAYGSFDFSEDGRYVRLDSPGVSPLADQVREVATGRRVSPAPTATWIPSAAVEVGYELTARSSSKALTFNSRLIYDYEDEYDSEEAVVREVTDARGDLRYALTDDVPYLTYEERAEPESCDLEVFSMCGNALQPLARAPIKAVFAPAGDTLAVQYGVPSLGAPPTFNHLRVYDASDGSYRFSIGGREHPVVDFAYSIDSRRLGVAYLDGSIELWDIATQSYVFGARHMSMGIGSLTYTRDGQFLLLQRYGRLEIRRASDGALVSRHEVEAFDYAPADNRLALAGPDHTIRVLDLDTGLEVLTLEHAHADVIYTVAYSPDGRYLATAGRDCDIKLWDLASKTVLHHFQETRRDPYEIDVASRVFMYALKFIPDTDLLVGYGSWGTVVAWDIDSGATRYSLASAPLEYFNGMVTLQPHFPDHVEVDEAANRFVIGGAGYDLTTGEPVEAALATGRAPAGCAESGALSQDQGLLFTRGTESHEGELCVLDAGTLKLIETIPVAAGGSYAYSLGWPQISPDGRQLIVTAGGIVFVYQIGS